MVSADGSRRIFRITSANAPDAKITTNRRNAAVTTTWIEPSSGKKYNTGTTVSGNNAVPAIRNRMAVARS